MVPQRKDYLFKVLKPAEEPENLLKPAIDTTNVQSTSQHLINHIAAKELHHQIPLWQSAVKRIMDVIFSFVSLGLLSPLFLFVALRTMFSSKGKVIYSQTRIGRNGKKFCIYKFRSMYENAEKNGPALSFENDVRITKWGKIMRSRRLDELPQLWNILKGEMSFVGPRPEREFYIAEMNKRTNNFSYLLTVKPGLTSLGMVKFGYASNVDEMIKRMKYDIYYVENISLLFDFKIMLYTLKTIFLGIGK